MVASKEKLESADGVRSASVTDMGRNVTVRMTLGVEGDGAFTNVKTDALSEVIRGLSSDGYTVGIAFMDLNDDATEAKVAVQANK